ncbi:MAG: T9SS type A sorting domain-containing protein [Chitinophagaceae bacterium]|nr:T9SS type A sorting domain-containing protein [Chitinophagaceae bacterium]
MLKKITTILIVLFGITFTSFAQLKSTNDVDAHVKIVKFYPNPATTAINFELPGGYEKSYSIQIFNFMGKKVSEINVGTLRINFSLDGFYRGVYIYQLRDKYGKVVDSGKFQVVR